MNNEHIERVSKHELKQQKKLKERRDTFDEVFKEDLEEYKATGSIPSKSLVLYFLKIIIVQTIFINIHTRLFYLSLELPVSSEGPSLDEIVLDIDSKIFDEFLEN